MLDCIDIFYLRWINTSIVMNFNRKRIWRVTKKEKIRTLTSEIESEMTFITLLLCDFYCFSYLSWRFRIKQSRVSVSRQETINKSRATLTNMGQHYDHLKILLWYRLSTIFYLFIYPGSMKYLLKSFGWSWREWIRNGIEIINNEWMINFLDFRLLGWIWRLQYTNQSHG